ncbi:hypothetical protein OVS_00585 [Mycoplasma ovis str. Michigan]|uniref:Uncharacterized protein n=1 Tax=Mycoplasma ovis str. Michigan TaxID=1415773 RepID=A0ABM5P101_9MOLU|nr:hypothetical protein [Mycoplasma ovis]AHC40108.1 hypothetical protein OVS_00585 [Mycoplasma ovis str. Michigan]
MAFFSLKVLTFVGSVSSAPIVWSVVSNTTLDRQFKEVEKESSEESKASRSSSSSPIQEEPSIDNCRELTKSSEGRIILCYDKQNDKKVKFTFMESLGTISGETIDNVAYDVGQFSFASPNRLNVEVIGIENGGRENRSKWFDLPDHLFSDKSYFSLKKTSFTKEQCVVEWVIDQTEQKKDWKVIC